MRTLIDDAVLTCRVFMLVCRLFDRAVKDSLSVVKDSLSSLKPFALSLTKVSNLAPVNEKSAFGKKKKN